MKHFFRDLLAGIGFLTLFCFSSCKEQTHYVREAGEVFHTLYHMTYASDSSAQEVVERALQELNYTANPFDSTSLLYAINNNRTQVVNAGFIELWTAARECAERSQGAYDVTVAPLVNAWGFGFAPSPWPDGEVPRSALDSILSFVGYQKVTLRGDTLIKSDPRVQIDFSSIAKGMASDYVARALQAQGITSYMVEIGGEIAYAGVNPEGKPWSIGINKPLLDSLGLEHYNEYEVIIELPQKGGGVATSGNYRNFKVRDDGTLYAHTIDPRSGHPVETDVLSATILHADCFRADALATASMALGAEAAERMLQAIPGVEYLLIVASPLGAEEPYELRRSAHFPKNRQK